MKREKKCTKCNSGEVEDVKHFLMGCKAWNGEREEMLEKMKKVTGLEEVYRGREECGMDSCLACKMSLLQEEWNRQ